MSWVSDLKYSLLGATSSSLSSLELDFQQQGSDTEFSFCFPIFELHAHAFILTSDKLEQASHATGGIAYCCKSGVLFNGALEYVCLQE